MKKHRLQILVSVLLILCLMTSCKGITVFKDTLNQNPAQAQEDKEEGKDGQESQTEDSNENKEESGNGDQDEEPETWDEFTEDFFISSVTSDTLTMHYFVQYPEKMGIEEVEDTLGTLYSEEPEEDEYTWASDYINEINAFDDADLTEQQRRDKETLLWYLETEKMVEGEEFAYYQELAAPMYGIQSNIPINFANYAFNEERDIDHYLALLDDVPRYMDELFLYEKERANRGYGMSDYLIDQVISECEDFLGDSVDDNVLVTSFAERLEEMNLDSAKKDELIESNHDKVENSVYPAYQTFMESMASLKGTCKEHGALPEFEHGKEYFEYLARSASSSDRSVEEIEELLNQYVEEQYTEVYTIYAEDPDIFDKMDNPNYGAEDPVDILELIASRMGDVLVPDIGAAEYTVKYVPKSLESQSNPAFCFIPQIDNIQSTIYFNQSPEYDNMDFFITVAHEGYPGHMYQNTYYYRTNPAHFRHIIDFSGYTEGWAVFISYQAVSLSDINDPNLERILALDEAIGYEMSALADIGVNYDGWSLEELADFFSGYGLTEEDLEDLYYQLISTPGVYLSYSEACCEYWELQKYAKEQLGTKYNDVDFNRVILDEGPTSFTILKERVDDYIASQR